MVAVLRQRGEAVDYTPEAAVAAGDVVVQGDLVGIARLDIAAGVLGALAVTGVFAMPKARGSGSAIAAGTMVHWDETSQEVTAAETDGASVPTAFPYLGKAVAAAADDDATVQVRLQQ